MSGDRVIRFTTAAVVCAVAAVAAVVSYSHIYGLGRAHGQDGTAARLLPLSVDGLILAASLVLLHEARNDRDAPRLARFMLWLGIAATIGANIAYGAGYGLLRALISAWPAVAFIGSVEIAMQQVRRARVARAAVGHAARFSIRRSCWPGCCLRSFLFPCPWSRPQNRVCHVHAACRLAGAGSADHCGDRVHVPRQEDAAAAGGADP